MVKLGNSPEWKAGFEPNSHGFQPRRSTHDAISDIFDSVKQKPKDVLDVDISKCMSLINHDALLEKIGSEVCRQLIKKCLNSGVFDYGKLADIYNSHKFASIRALIKKLNPVIRGWGNYFSTQVSKKIFRLTE
ncbi:MAG: reverse transcriptase domain-containing protein [Trichodesmium sp. St16_bin4-tuft]|nr:hypothetical protein [Trichodesmium sp. MAG_R01]MDE5067766.1 reverse transcriptase domain-containing protein [Trichodesmium sp. St4_bin8_1]MDE5071914.1 reverse transcriptase domain-containing protein [Trichodesmium sp. St5_bin8]MDE5092057.1 reverse transcriptase domain-containing protein [Trichodesmium sp. St18_bin3_1_1]MDE5099523.1 reverse transcriptase domain-containing protein [Trichodesmium sp. St16_bin4-tuft]MDE5105463.1 reverse transcriptase domain-containing protein [Trichodesmium sp